ncbi:MAG: prepilin-type N-terminal cleavage/methylation domain-containing protein [Clostridia bacterium]|nr:prepilin-type N-terminal cleavage/methylation domain-containing protein [Clostridia bacterium]
MKKLKKGFTLVELVIVIAVIAVLAAVLIPTFSGIIQRSKISADTQLAKQLSTLAADADTIQEFVDAVEADDNLSVNSLVAQAAGNKFLWVEKAASHSIVYVDGSLKPIGDNIPQDILTDAKLWTVVTAANQVVNNAKLNYFLAVDSNQNFVLNNIVSFDTGKNTLKGNLTIQNNESNNAADLNGNFAGTITINAPNATINQNGSVATLDVTAVAGNSLHVNGFVKNLNVKKCKIELANTAYVSKLTVKATEAKVINGGVVAELNKDRGVTLSETNFVKSTGTVLAATENSGINAADYKNNNFAISIADRAGLENFRDAVNGGATYQGITVGLTADITLNDGWTPIGEFARAKTAQGFQGTFDGNGHTISNLNNKGYVPAESALFSNETTIANKKEYTYGLFGFVSNATIIDLKLTNVDIDIPSNTSAYGDSVAALVGYSYGSITLEDITVGEVVQNTSRIAAYDGVGGILGRAYGDGNFATDTDVVTIMDCQNYAIVSAGEKAGGIVGLISNKAKLDINNANNYGTVNVTAEGLVRNQAFAGGIIAMVGSPAEESKIEGSTNNGNVTITSNLANGQYFADGIIGETSTETGSATEVATPNTTNNGTVTTPQAQA